MSNVISKIKKHFVYDVIIRTISDATTLEILDTTIAKVYQYGDCGIIDATVGMDSLYVEGHVNFIEAKAGHIVVNGLTDAMFTSATSKTVVNVEGNVTHAHAATEEGAIALNTGSSSDAVVWDYDGDAETTNKHPDLLPGTTTPATMKEEKAVNAVSAQVTREGQKSGKNYVARIFTKGYETLKAALDEVKTNETVTLLADGDISNIGNGTLYINNSNDNITFDLNGYVLSSNTRVIQVDEVATFTIKNGILKHNDNPIHKTSADAVIMLNAFGKINIDNCKLICEYNPSSLQGKMVYGISTNGSTTIDAQANITNSEFVGFMSFYISASGTYKFKNCIFGGTNGIAAGDVTLEDCVFKTPLSSVSSCGDPTDSLKPYYKSRDGLVSSGDNLAIIDRRSKGYTLNAVTIKNCSFYELTDSTGACVSYAIRITDCNNASGQEQAAINISDCIFNNYDQTKPYKGTVYGGLYSNMM